MTLRKALFWTHLVCGIAAGILIFIMSATGVALTYQKQLTAWADKRACRVERPAGADPLPASELVERFRRAEPGRVPVALSLSSDPDMPASVTAAPGGTIFVNPYTGEVLGPGATGVRSFFRVMTGWHRWLALSGDNLRWGRAATGAGNLLFLFLALGGLYLWWPRRWTRAALRPLLWFRTGIGGKARDGNWHNVFGFWCLVPLVLIILSGVVISYAWASRLVFQFAGSTMSMPARRGAPAPPPGALEAPLRREGADAAIRSVRERVPGWKTLNLDLPAPEAATLSLAVEEGYGGQPQLRSTVTADRESGKILKTEHFAGMDRGVRARIWMRFVHTGEYYGLAGQTVAGIASLAGLVLVWTGFALALRRYAAWLGRRN
jgi:uncharacterized iron-regulated membrane protein